MKLPVFMASKGPWGEHGMIRIPFWRWLLLRQNFVTRVRWVKCHFSLLKKES